MNVDDMILVSIDDHVIEPPDMFDRHVPAKYADQAPQVVVGDDGVEQWVFQGRDRRRAGLNAVVSWPQEEWGWTPAGSPRCVPGAYDVHERVRDMNRNGILASMCFPTFAGFSGGISADDKDGHLAMIAGVQRLAHRRVGARLSRAGSSRSPSSRCGIQRSAVAEVRRVAAKGCRGDHHARAAAHPGPARATTTSTTGTRSSRRCPTEHRDVPAHRPGLRRDQQAARRADRQPDHPRHPGLGARRAGPAVGPGAAQLPRPQGRLSEAGIGWIPFYLDRCDRHYTNQRGWVTTSAASCRATSSASTRWPATSPTRRR